MSRTEPFRFLVTAGNTREMIDRVRDWGNIFTGNTGYDIARALSDHGQVEFLTSNPSHLASVAAQGDGSTIRAAGFRSHADLKTALAQRMAQHRYDAVFMTAAIADYRPAGAFAVVERSADAATGRETWVVQNVQAGKVKSNYDQIAVLGEKTEKLVDLFRREWDHRGLLFKFKLEVGIAREQLLKIGRESRTASGADFLVANTLEMVGGEQAGAFLISDEVERWVARHELAQVLSETAMNALRRASRA